MGLALFALMCEQMPSARVTLISPLSVASALAVALSGATAGDETMRELTQLLGAGPAAVAEMSQAILAAGAEGTGVSLDVANSVWAKGSIKPEFVELAHRVHRAQAFPMPTATYGPVNDWVAAATAGRIRTLLEGVPDPLLVALLVNTVLFKGSWAAQFDPKLTRPGLFRPGEGDAPPLDAHFMSRKAKLAASESVAALGGAGVVRLDYGVADGPFCALFVLPPQPGEAALAATVARLSTADLNSVVAQDLREQETAVFLPRFRAESEPVSLVPPLRGLGLRAVFDGQGGFLAMSDDPLVYVADVLHKVVLEVNI